jgi:hypothetical protein
LARYRSAEAALEALPARGVRIAAQETVAEELESTEQSVPLRSPMFAGERAIS